MEKYAKVLDLIDREWVKNNPDTTLDLIHCLVEQIYHYRDSIDSLHHQMLLTSAIIESYRDKNDFEK